MNKKNRLMIKNEKSKPLIAIFGAGVSGLKMAHECIKQNMDVDVYEARDLPGGKCIGKIKSGLPSELTHRQMFPSNKVLLNTLKEITTPTGNLLDNIEPITNVQFVWTHKSKTMNFPRHLFSRLTKLIDDLKSANVMVFDGVPLKDVYWFKTKLTLSNSKEMEGPISKYLEYDKRPELANFSRKLLSTWIGASDNSRTKDILQLFLYKEIAPSPLSPPNYSITLNGPISESLITPWYDYLKKEGVNFHFNSKLQDLNTVDTRVESAVLESGENIVANAYAIATPPNIVLSILPELSPLISIESVKSHGFQLHLKEIPKKYLKKTTGIIIDSAWGLSYKIYHSGKYHNTIFTEGTIATLSITATRMEKAKGIIHNKSLIECSYKEMKEEILAQIGLAYEGVDSCFSGNLRIGPGALIVSLEESKKEQYQNWFKGPIISEPKGEESCWIIQNQLINPSYKNKVYTDSSRLENIYLGGEWVNHHKQKWTIPSTLERSMENALLCVEDILKDIISE